MVSTKSIYHDEEIPRFIRKAVPQAFSTPAGGSSEYATEHFQLRVRRLTDSSLYDISLAVDAEGAKNTAYLGVWRFDLKESAKRYELSFTLPAVQTLQLGQLVADFSIATLWYLAGHPWIRLRFACYDSAVMYRRNVYQPVLMIPDGEFLHAAAIRSVRIIYDEESGVHLKEDLSVYPNLKLGILMPPYWEHVPMLSFIALFSQEMAMAHMQSSGLISYIQDTFAVEDINFYAMFWPFRHIWNMLELMGIVNYDISDLKKTSNGYMIYDFVTDSGS